MTNPKNTRRIIATIEELDKLPHDSVIRDHDGATFVSVLCEGYDQNYLAWNQVGETWPLDSSEIQLPATVLAEGGDQ